MHRARLILVALLVALPLLGWVVAARAQEIRSGTNLNFPAGRTIDSTLFAAGRTVHIGGVVNGDVFCAGQDVTVNAQVHGDVICAGQNVTINGHVSGSVRVAGQDVKLGAGVAGNTTVMAQTFTQQPESSIRGDTTILAQDAVMHGFSGRDVWAGVRTLTISGTINRNVQAQLQHLQLDSSAHVRGDIIYTSTSDLQRSGGAQVNGNVTKHTPPSSPAQNKRKTAWMFLLYLYIALLIIALVLVLVIPQAFEQAVRVARSGLAKTFVIGLVASIVVPIILIAVMITFVGIPLALLFGLAWLLAVLVAGPFAAYLLGRMLLRGPTNAILVMLVGAAILFFLELLPVIGIFVWLVATWFGLGTILRSFRGRTRPRYTLSSLPTETAPPRSEPQAP